MSRFGLKPSTTPGSLLFHVKSINKRHEAPTDEPSKDTRTIDETMRQFDREQKRLQDFRKKGK